MVEVVEVSVSSLFYPDIAVEVVCCARVCRVDVRDTRVPCIAVRPVHANILYVLLWTLGRLIIGRWVEMFRLVTSAE